MVAGAIMPTVFVPLFAIFAILLLETVLLDFVLYYRLKIQEEKIKNED